MQKKYEAVVFLKEEHRNMNINRFKSNSESLNFVNELYNLGAEVVFITGINNFKSEKEMMADQIIVKLPKDLDKRSAIFNFYNMEITKESLIKEDDKGQEELVFWWD